MRPRERCSSLWILHRKKLIQGVAIGYEALLQKALACPNDLALTQAELLCNRWIGPVGAPVFICCQVEKKKKRYLLQGEPVEEIPEAVVSPGKMRRESPHTLRNYRLVLRDFCFHDRGVYLEMRVWKEEDHEVGAVETAFQEVPLETAIEKENVARRDDGYSWRFFGKFPHIGRIARGQGAGLFCGSGRSGRRKSRLRIADT